MFCITVSGKPLSRTPLKTQLQPCRHLLGLIPRLNDFRYIPQRVGRVAPRAPTIAISLPIKSGIYRFSLAIGITLLLLAGFVFNVSGVIFDGGVDPANLGKGDWIYFIQSATNQLGGNVPSVHDLPTFMAYEKSQGIKYLIVKAGDGGNDFDGNYSFPQFNGTLVSQAHAAGLQIFGYTRSYGTNVPAEIALAAKVYNLGADGFVLDAEAEWESPTLANGPALATQLCSGIKAQFPTKFLGHAPLPIISFHSTFPYAQFGYYCDAVMPQDYWQDGGLGALVSYSPSNMVARMDSEWRTFQQSLKGDMTNAIKPLAPLAQGWNPTSTNITTGTQITQFFNALKTDPNPVTTGGYKGVNFWRADLHTADIWTGIGANTIGISNSLPSFTTQPQDHSVAQGSNWTFTAVASGYPPPTYQWRFNTTNITTATNTSYTVTAAQLTNQGNYSVLASNTSGTTASSNAFLTVSVPPVINNQPQSVTVSQGSNATFTANASGIPAPGYQWQFNSTNIALATAASYTVTNAQPADQGNYSVVVTNIGGSAVSSNAILTVESAPAVTSVLRPSQTVTPGAHVLFFATVTGSPTLLYQWLYSSASFAAATNIPGATNVTYSITSAQASQAGNYWLFITNAYGSTVSPVQALFVNTPAAITSQPQSQAVGPGGSATFFVTAAGTPSPFYQWFFNSASIGGATSSSYTMVNAQTNNVGNYSVLVSNSLGSATSSNALLTVVLTPLQFQAVNVLAGGAVQMTLTGVTGTNCCVKISSNLVDWVVLTNLLNTNGTIQFTDSISNNSVSRFYRAQAGP